MLASTMSVKIKKVTGKTLPAKSHDGKRYVLKSEVVDVAEVHFSVIHKRDDDGKVFGSDEGFSQIVSEFVESGDFDSRYGHFAELSSLAVYSGYGGEMKRC